jgi:hypothetical protein
MQYTRRIWSTSSLTRPEKRLARTLLLLARYGKEDQPQQVLPKCSREMLQYHVLPHKSDFMNKFNKMGNKYNGGFKSIARFWVSSSTSDARLRRASEDDLVFAVPFNCDLSN